MQNTQTQTQNPNSEKIENPNPDLNLCVFWMHLSGCIKFTRFSEFEVPDKLEAFVEAAKNGEFSAERVFPKEQIKNGMVHFFVLPVSVCHGELVKVG